MHREFGNCSDKFCDDAVYTLQSHHSSNSQPECINITKKTDKF